MLRIPIVLFLILCHAAVLSAKDAEPAAPALSESQVINNLSMSDSLAWERAMELKKSGLSIVETGKRLMTRPPSPFSTPDKAKRDQEDGKRMVEDGNKKIAEAEQTLKALRAKAAKAAPAAAEVEIGQTYSLAITPEHFAKVMPEMVEKMLFELWGADYKRIFLLGAWANTENGLVNLPEMKNVLLTEMRQKDGNRYTIVPDQNIPFQYLIVRNKSMVEFPGKTRMLSNFSTALVIAELIPSPDGRETWVSLRAIDADSLKLINSQLFLCPNDASLNLLLGMAEDEAAASPLPAEGLSVTLVDENNFIERITPLDSPYTFGTRFVGNETSYRGRRSGAIIKSLLLPSGVNLSEHALLTEVLVGEDNANGDQLGYNAYWELTPQQPGMLPNQTFELKAVSLRNGEEVPVVIGTMETQVSGAGNEAS